MGGGPRVDNSAQRRRRAAADFRLPSAIDFRFRAGGEPAPQGGSLEAALGGKGGPAGALVFNRAWSETARLSAPYPFTRDGADSAVDRCQPGDVGGGASCVRAFRGVAARQRLPRPGTDQRNPA